MQDPQPSPQVAIVSSQAGRARVQPLVGGLRARGVGTWWDGDGLKAGEESQEATWAILQRASVTCVVLSEASLVSPYFRRAIDVVLGAGRHLVPIRISELNPSVPLPAEIAQRQWLDLVKPEDLERALTELERIVQSVGGPPVSDAPRASSVPPAANARPSAPSGSRPDASPAIALLFGEGTSAETWAMSPALQEVLERAARLHPKASGEPTHPIAFSTLLSALFYAGGQWAQWCQGIAHTSGFRVDALRPIPVTPAEVSRPLRTTSSAANLLTSAREYARHSGTMLDVQHLIAALIYEPAGHERDLESYHVDRVVWANALIDETGTRSPADVALLTQLRDKAFPVTPVENNLSKPNAESNPPTATQLPDQAATGPRDPWAVADAGLRRALAWVVATAGTNAPGVIGVRELLAGLVRNDATDSPLWAVVRSVAPGLAAEAGEPPWLPIYRRLGVPLPPPTPPPLPGEPPRRSAEVDAVLAKALALEPRLAPSSSGLSEPSVFLALWQPGAAGEAAALDALLPALDLDADALLRGVQEHADTPGDMAQLIQEIRAMRGAFRPWDRPHVDNDRVSGPITEDKDLLDARKPALRFAKLLAARDVHPPIALGLFGNWGSGKTFFMGLMRGSIARLVDSGGRDYVRRVVQIEFNAWHYHDTNLWASLAMRIFEELARELAGPTEDAVQAKRKELHQKIRSSEARRSEAEERRTQALGRRAVAVKDLETRRARREALQQESVRLRLEAAWRVVTTCESFRELQATARGLLRHFGISAAFESVEDLKRLRREIEETSSRSLGLFTAIGQRFQGLATGARTTALLVLVAASALALGRGFETVAELLKIRLPDFSGTVLEVAALVSTAAAWCGRRVKEVRGAIDQIARVEADLARAEKDAKLPEDVQKLQADIAALDKEIHRAGEEVSAAEREIADATTEIDRINRGGLVYDFLQERRAADSYVGQLGLISTIRQDLERLGVLLKDFGAHGQNPIERIILYIDDLDRCHPDKVVEVLQAVHLLLAFDLFNVVVGVDARWLERSLRRQYVGRSGGGRTQADDPFSPQDYLEKIFQIPYALSRIDEEGFKRLIGGLIETRTDYQAKERRRAQDEAAKAAAAAQPSTTGDAPASPAASVTETPAAADSGASAGGAGSADARGGRADAGGPADTSRPSELEPAAGAAPALYFEDHEETFVQRLYGFIDRPRLAKRFVNIYRLLRVRADDEGESGRFAGSSTSPEYRAALVLLAIQVGHPTVATKVADAIERAAASTSWPDVLDNLAQGRVPGLVCSEREKSEIAAVAAKLTPIGQHVPAELDAYRRWAARVACYSFDWHRAEATRGDDGRGAPAPKR